MKVAILIYDISIRGGTHKQVLRLCQYLKKQEVDFVICTKYLDIKNTYPEFSEFPIISLENQSMWTAQNRLKRTIIDKIKKRIYYFIEQKKLYQLIPENVDIVNVHDNGFIRVMDLVKKHRKKVIWQINDLPNEFSVGIANNKKETLFFKLDRKYAKYVAKKVDVITVNVTKNAERVMKCMERKAEVLYCGVDKNYSLIPHKIPDKKAVFKILSTGVFFPHRNYETLVKVIEVLKKEGIDVQLDIIGNIDADKVYAKQIFSLIENLKLKDSVKIWGQVDEKTYNKLFNETNLFVFININQSWGLAVFEAMSGGMPVIVSNSVGAIELLHNNEDAIIVNPENIEEICQAIKRIRSDKDLYQKLSYNARKAAEKYSWDNMYSSKLLEIYKKI